MKKETGRLEGIHLLKHLMSNWRWQIKIELNQWREQDEQAYREIKELIIKAEQERS